MHRLLKGLGKPQRYRRLRSKITTRYTLDFNQTFESLIFVAGTGRSGTTWLLELVNAGHPHRVIFEPFRPEHGILGERILPRYMRPGDDDPEVSEFVRKILLGKFKSNRLTGRDNERLISTSRILKDVDSNLRLGWLRSQFPYFPIVYIIRHPCAVASSRQRLGNELSIDEYLDESALVADHLAPYVGALSQLSTPFEKAVASWCIENYVPLKQIDEGLELVMVFYEDLVTDPDETLQHVFGALGQTADRVADEDLAKPSLTTWRENDPLSSPARAIDDWQRRLTPGELERARELVTLFGLDSLYSFDSGRPRHNGSRVVSA
jgi:Sulfotransferase family